MQREVMGNLDLFLFSLFQKLRTKSVRFWINAKNKTENGF